MLAFMILNIIMNEYIQSVCKTKYSKLEESPEAGPLTGFRLTPKRTSFTSKNRSKTSKIVGVITVSDEYMCQNCMSRCEYTSSFGL